MAKSLKLSTGPVTELSKYHSREIGIVINRVTTHERDLLVTLLTQQSGKITALAKGAKSIKSNRLGHLQLGNVVKVGLYHKENRYWISESQSVNSFMTQPKNLAQVSLLFYTLEVTNRLTADRQHNNGVFSAALALIKAIGDNNVSLYLQQEVRFLQLFGFGIPPEITISLSQKKYRQTQKQLRHFLESIIERPLESPKLFR